MITGSDNQIEQRTTGAGARRALLIGCGNLGLKIADGLMQQGYRVTGARRSIGQLPATLVPLSLDVTKPDTLSDISVQPWDVVVVTLTAAANPEAYRAVYFDGFGNVLAAIERSASKPLLLFVSSASVYAQSDGSLVDETSATAPDSYSGQILLQAEQLLHRSGLPHSAVRFSGIYGAGRGQHLLRVLQDGRICPAQPASYSNRIHIDDCTRVILHLVARYQQGLKVAPVYLASDNQSAPLREVMEWLAMQHGIDTASLTPDYIPRRGGNRRCHSTQLLSEGFHFKYNDYKQGYSDRPAR